MKTNCPVVFWAWRKRPSFVMRGIQVAEELARHGFQTVVRFGPSRVALRGVHDSIIICVKSTPRFTAWLRRRRNRIVYDAIDFTTARSIPAHVDAVIAGTNYLRSRLQTFLDPNVTVKTIYHHADPHLKPHKAGDQALRLAYIGDEKGSMFIKGEIPELDVISFLNHRDWREEIRNYNAHFSARMDPNKSVIKLANVATLGAVFLTGAEPGCDELLGKEYPFYLRNPENLDTVLEDVKRLKEAVGSPLWKDARDRIDQTRPNLTIDATARAYEELLAQLP
ncbi:MAG TPA: hypothetical protein VI895_10050 [Bdellovibrionota bacterium]|nr:hypothetical protein [Bdellovibrionota bacterium]